MLIFISKFQKYNKINQKEIKILSLKNFEWITSIFSIKYLLMCRTQEVISNLFKFCKR